MIQLIKSLPAPVRKRHRVEHGSFRRMRTRLTTRSPTAHQPIRISLLKCFGASYLAYLILTWDGIHLRALEPASMATTASRTAAAQARRSCAQAIPIVIQSRFHRLRPKTSGPLRRTRSSLSVVLHVLSWPPRFLHPVACCRYGQHGPCATPFSSESRCATETCWLSVLLARISLVYSDQH